MRTPELRGCIGIDFEVCRLHVSKGAALHEEANRQSGAQVKCHCTKAHIMSYKREELAAIGTCSQAVYVQDGDLTFSLESVKKLKELMDENRVINPRMVVYKAGYSLCEDKDLPEVFQPVCKKEDAPMIFERLYLIAGEADLCEICANAACSGCF